MYVQKPLLMGKILKEKKKGEKIWIHQNSTCVLHSVYAGAFVFARVLWYLSSNIGKTALQLLVQAHFFKKAIL